MPKPRSAREPAESLSAFSVADTDSGAPHAGASPSHCADTWRWTSSMIRAVPAERSPRRSTAARDRTSDKPTLAAHNARTSTAAAPLAAAPSAAPRWTAPRVGSMLGLGLPWASMRSSRPPVDSHLDPGAASSSLCGSTTAVLLPTACLYLSVRRDCLPSARPAIDSRILQRFAALFYRRQHPPHPVFVPSTSEPTERRLVQQLCAMVRQNARASGKAPLNPSQLTRHQRLEQIRHMVHQLREAKKKVRARRSPRPGWMSSPRR